MKKIFIPLTLFLCFGSTARSETLKFYCEYKVIGLEGDFQIEGSNQVSLKTEGNWADTALIAEFKTGETPWWISLGLYQNHLYFNPPIQSPSYEVFISATSMLSVWQSKRGSTDDLAKIHGADLSFQSTEYFSKKQYWQDIHCARQVTF